MGITTNGRCQSLNVISASQSHQSGVEFRSRIRSQVALGREGRIKEKKGKLHRLPFAFEPPEPLHCIERGHRALHTLSCQPLLNYQHLLKRRHHDQHAKMVLVLQEEKEKCWHML